MATGYAASFHSAEYYMDMNDAMRRALGEHVPEPSVADERTFERWVRLADGRTLMEYVNRERV